MSTQTKTFDFVPYEDVFVRSVHTSAELPEPVQESATRVGLTGLSRFGAFAAPIAVLASFAAPAPLASFAVPAPPALVRRIFSSGEASSSAIRRLRWDFNEEWRPTEVMISQAEIAALNHLYSLTLPESFSLDLPDA